MTPSCCPRLHVCIDFLMIRGLVPIIPHKIAKYSRTLQRFYPQDDPSLAVCFYNLKLFRVDQGNITTPVLRAITNLTCCEDGDFITEQFINHDMLINLRRLLTKGGYATRLECLAVLSNIAASMNHAQALIDGDFVQYFIEIVENVHEPPRLRRDAAWGLANITTHRDLDQIVVVADNGDTLRILISFLCSNEEHPLTNLKIVGSIGDILVAGDDPNAQYQYNAKPLLPNEYGL
jgi:hypothetical protein